MSCSYSAQVLDTNNKVLSNLNNTLSCGDNTTINLTFNYTKDGVDKTIPLIIKCPSNFNTPITSQDGKDTFSFIGNCSYTAKSNTKWIIIGIIVFMALIVLISIFLFFKKIHS